MTEVGSRATNTQPALEREKGVQADWLGFSRGTDDIGLIQCFIVDELMEGEGALSALGRTGGSEELKNMTYSLVRQLLTLDIMRILLDEQIVIPSPLVPAVADMRGRAAEELSGSGGGEMGGERGKEGAAMVRMSREGADERDGIGAHLLERSEGGGRGGERRRGGSTVAACLVTLKLR